MSVKRYRPITPSMRGMVRPSFDEITTDKPEKSLLRTINSKAGRNNQGRITVRHQGGGVRRKYRVIDFKRNKDGIPATVASIEYDPNRSAYIALLHYADGKEVYTCSARNECRASCAEWFGQRNKGRKRYVNERYASRNSSS